MRLIMIPIMVFYILTFIADNGLPNSQFETDNRVGTRGLPRPSTLSISGHLTAFSFYLRPPVHVRADRVFGELHKTRKK